MEWRCRWLDAAAAGAQGCLRSGWTAFGELVAVAAAVLAAAVAAPGPVPGDLAEPVALVGPFAAALVAAAAVEATPRIGEG